MNRIISFFMIVVIVIVQSGTAPVLAISKASLEAINGNSAFYDPSNAGQVCQSFGATPTASGPLIGNDNEQKIFNYFIAKKLGPIQTAGIVGNFGQESHWSPTTPGGYLAQWGGARLTNLQKFAASQNKPVTDLQVQLDFVWKELNESYTKVLKNLNAATTVEDATNQFMGPTPLPNGGTTDGYENPGKPELQKRINYAKDALKLYGGAAATTAALVTTITGSGGGCSSAVGNSQNTKFIDGFTVYNQCDPAWASKPYGNGTICQNACGPSSMAMIITNLKGTTVTPDTIATFAMSNGLYINGVGSSWNIAPVVAKAYGLKAVAIGADVAKITATLQAGGLVAAPGSGAKPFTSGGHYIVIRAVTAEGKWKVGDSGHSNTSSLDWDPQQLVNEMHGGGVYAISK